MQLEFLEAGVDPDPRPAEEDKPSSQESGFVSFRMTGVDSSFANGLRRVLLAEIPTLAITTVELTHNTSVFHDEFITHRIGLIPLKSPFHEIVDNMPQPQECACQAENLEQGNVSYGSGCDSCQIRCEFDVMCPPHKESVEFSTDDIRTTDPRFQMAVGAGSKIYLAKLGRGQRIKGVAYAKKGIAKQHSRHMAVGTVAFRYDADIKLNTQGISELTEEHRRVWIGRCPAKVFDLVDGDVVVSRPDDCIMCRECTAMDAPFEKLHTPLVSVRNKKDDNGYSVVMKVESVGHMKAIDTVRVALIILKRKLVAVQQGLLKVRGGNSVAVGSDGAAGGGGRQNATQQSQSQTQQQQGAQSSVVVGQSLLESEQDLLHMAEKNAEMW